MASVTWTASLGGNGETWTDTGFLNYQYLESGAQPFAEFGQQIVIMAQRAVDAAAEAVAAEAMTGNPVVDTITANKTDAVTNTVTTVATYGHDSTGTPLASFGVRNKWTLESSTTAAQDAAALDVTWTDATHATRTSRMSIKLVNSASALTETARFDVSGATFTGTNSLADITGTSVVVGAGTGTVTSRIGHLRNNADVNALLRLSQTAISEWDFSLRNSPRITALQAGSLEIIPLNSNTDFAIGNSTGTVASIIIKNTGHVLPGSDNGQDLGSASFRMREIFAGTGTINTSDAREKTEVSPLTDNEIAASKALAKEIGTFRFLKSIEKKGNLARKHVGMTVQRAIEIMQSFDLDPFSYGFICHDAWDEKIEQWDDDFDIQYEDVYGYEDYEFIDKDGVKSTVQIKVMTGEKREVSRTLLREAGKKIIPSGDRYGFRPDQLNAFILAGIAARLDALEV